MAQQGPIALPPPPTDPRADIPMVPYYPQGPVNVPTGVAQTVHIMGRGETTMFIPPQRPRRDPPLPSNQPVQPIPSLPAPEPRRARSNSGGRRRWESESGNPFARVALAPRRGGLGDTPFVPVAPAAPKMAPRPVDPNVFRVSSKHACTTSESTSTTARTTTENKTIESSTNSDGESAEKQNQ